MPAKALNRALITLIVTLLVLAGVFMLLRVKEIQTAMVNVLLRRIESKYDGRLSVGSVLVRWPHRIEIRDLLVMDPLNDTLLYTPLASASVRHLNVDRRQLSLSRVLLEDPLVNIRQLPSGEMNYESLLKAVSSTDSVSAKKSLSLIIKQVNLRNGDFRLHRFGTLAKPGQLDPENLRIDSIELAVKDIEYEEGRTSGVIELLAFREQCGFSVSNLTTGFSWDSEGLRTTDLLLVTRHSRIESPSAKAFHLVKTAGIREELMLDVLLREGSRISPEDVRLLTGYDTGLPLPVQVSGTFTGTPANARLWNARLFVPGTIEFAGDLVYQYPGNFRDMFIDLKTRILSVNIPAIHRDLLSGSIPEIKVDIPTPLLNLGTVEYTGIFTGTPENFITTANWGFANGQFATNLTVNKNRPLKGYNFKGSVAATGFNPDEWTGEPTGVSGMEFNLDVDGVWDGKESVTALMTGDVSQFTVNGYTYQYLSINGLATGRNFDGSLRLRDPNASVDLRGTFDFNGSRPVMDFSLVVKQADLYALNLVKSDTLSRLNLEMRGNFTGLALDEMDGEILVTNTSFTNSNGTLPVNDLVIKSIPELGRRQITLSSEYADARLVGNVHLDDLNAQVRSLISRFMPALSAPQKIRTDHLNDFAFNIQLTNPLPVTKVLFPGFLCKDNTRLAGSYNAVSQTFTLEGISPQFVAGGSQFTGFDILLQTRGDSLVMEGDVGKIQLDRNTLFQNIRFDASLKQDRMDARLDWSGRTDTDNRGVVACSGWMESTPEGKLRGTFRFPSSQVVYKDSVWEMDSFLLVSEGNRLDVNGFRIRHKAEELSLAGTVSMNPADTLLIRFRDIHLENFNRFTGTGDLVLKGNATGEVKLFEMRNRGKFLTEALIDTLFVNGKPLGNTILSSRSQGAGEPLLMDVLIRRGSINTLHLKGNYHPQTTRMDFDLDVDKLRMDIANPFVNNELQDVRGIMTGKATIRGTLKDPLVNGEVMVQKGSFVVDYINTRFYFTHKVTITPDAFSIKDLDLQDEEGNHATVTGAVRHTRFGKIRLDLGVGFTDFLLLNELESRNMGYWGRGYGSGFATIRGPLRSLNIDVTARTSKKTKFYVPIVTTDEARELDFITYVEKPREDIDEDLMDFSEAIRKDYEVNLYGATVNIDIDATPDAEVQLIIDSKGGNVIRGRGNGNIRVLIPPTTRWSLNGDVTIEEGDYQFALQNMPVKRLQILPGATIKWTGNVSNPYLELDAVYKTKASVYDLLQDESNPELAQRLPVECHLLMNGNLQSPSVDFNIVLPPTSNDVARSQLQNLNKEELSRQVISLLVLNRFSPLQGTGSGTARGYEGAGISTTTELLSNQLNYWISQISRDFDVGFNYRPGDQLTSDEVEVALSKQFLDNRMTVNVNGNVDVRQGSTNANQLVGDVEVEYKLTPSGKVRVKAFTRANDHLLYEYAPYTQGIGLFYREEFNTFGELFKRKRQQKPGNGR